MNINTLYGFSGDGLVEILSISNTPSYLGDRLREDSTVKALAKRVPQDELKTEIRRLANVAEPTIEDSALAYAYLTALALQNKDQAVAFCREQEVSRLRWANQVVSSIPSERESTVVANLKFMAPLPSNFGGGQVAINSISVDWGE